MRFTEFVRVLGAAVAWTAFAAQAEIPAEVLDLAARVHYGFYQADVRALEAAQASLERLGDAPGASYYRDFAALRRAQLGLRDRDGTKRLSDCAGRAVDAKVVGRAAAEAWLLVAACALTAGDERRYEQALERARSYDDDHPRFVLLEAWHLEPEAARNAEVRAAFTAKLVAAVAAFESWQPALDDPDWGAAEALTALGRDALERGEVREARDLLERALLLAPDYRKAVELRTALQAARDNPRTL